jgi:heterodisulfide reductase subunit C
MAAVLNPELLADVAAEGDFDATACMNCGVCTAVCPVGLAALPRRVFHDAVVGRQDAVLAEQEAVYSCLLCQLCEVSCPAGVHITQNIRTLRRYLNHRILGL